MDGDVQIQKRRLLDAKVRIIRKVSKKYVQVINTGNATVANFFASKDGTWPATIDRVSFMISVPDTARADVTMTPDKTTTGL